MSRYIGADPEAMRDLASMVSRRSDALHDLEGRLRALISMTTWTGEDAEDFRTEWVFRTRPALLEAAYDLRRRGLHLARQADDQDSASAPEAMGAGIGDIGGGRRVTAYRGEPQSGASLPAAPLPAAHRQDVQEATPSSALLGEDIGTRADAHRVPAGRGLSGLPGFGLSGAEASADLLVTEHALWTDPTATRR